MDQHPVYTQSWVSTGDPLDIFGPHDLYFTVGGNIGSLRYSVPTFGIEWRPIWNPIVLDWWWPRKKSRTTGLLPLQAGTPRVTFDSAECSSHRLRNSVSSWSFPDCQARKWNCSDHYPNGRDIQMLPSLG